MLTIEDYTFPWERCLTLSQRQHWLAKYRATLLRNQTPAELQFAKILRRMGIRFLSQKGFLRPPRFIIVDFFLPKPHKLCIEIDGKGHQVRAQAQKDHFRDAYLRRRGFRVVRFTNEQVMSQADHVQAILLAHGVEIVARRTRTDSTMPPWKIVANSRERIDQGASKVELG